MRFAISIPQFVADGAFDPTNFRAHLLRAERFGFHSAWTLEQVIGTTPVLSPVETMAVAAAYTTRLRLGCTVFVTPLHNPVHLAKSLATLDQLSRGRLEVGVGIGGQRMFSAFEVDPSSLVARFNEGLRLMKALWTESRVTFEGRFWQLQQTGMEPKPFQKPHPPIWFGGSHPAAIRRAVRHGNGFFGAGSSPTTRFVDQVKLVREYLADEGRDPDTFGIAKRIYIAVDDDNERARRRAIAHLQRFYAQSPLVEIERLPVTGSPAQCAEGVREVIDGGAELILFTPLFDDAEHMERLATEVIPQVS
jgi:probable F420-dependent oxidoreductase